MATMTTDVLATADPAYLRELSSIDAPGMWDITSQGALAVSHKGRKKAMGMDDVTYSDNIIDRTTRRKWGWGRYHFRQELDINDGLKQSLHGKTCIDAAEFLMNYEYDQRDIDDVNTAARPAFETSTITQVDNPTADITPADIGAGNLNDNADADIGQSYVIVSEPNAPGVYNFHYGCVAAKKGGEVLTVEGFATGNVLTTPGWSFNVYDSVSTFHGHWQQGMTPQNPIDVTYPFTMVVDVA